MTPQPALDRRRFVLAALAAGVPVSLACAGAWRPLIAVVRSESLTNRLARLLADTDGAPAVGRAYLELAGAERSSRELVSAIAAELLEGVDTNAVTSVRLREIVADKVRRDFHEDAVFRADGWLISLTEGRLCALVVLA